MSVEVILVFLLTAAGCEQIYSMADAAQGINSDLWFCFAIWLHLFMNQNHRMCIGRLSKTGLNGLPRVAKRMLVEKTIL